MENYIGLKRTRMRQVIETERVAGIDENGFIRIQCSHYDSATGRTDYSMRRVSKDGDDVHLVQLYNFDDFSTFGEPKNDWDNEWPKILEGNRNRIVHTLS